MSNICIAKKITTNGIDFLDFAVDDSDNLLIFNTFKDASEFLKTEVGLGEQLLDFIITTTDAQKENQLIKDFFAKSKFVNASENIKDKAPVSEFIQPESFSVPQNNPVDAGSPRQVNKTTLPDDVECTFLLSCSQYEIINNEVLYNFMLDKALVPVIAFIDPNKPDEIIQTPNFELKATYVAKA